MRSLAIGLVAIIGLFICFALIPQQNAQAQICYDQNKTPIPCDKSNYLLTQDAKRKLGFNDTPTPPSSTPRPTRTATTVATPKHLHTRTPNPTPSLTLTPSPTPTEMPLPQLLSGLRSNSQTCSSSWLNTFLTGLVFLAGGILLRGVLKDWSDQWPGFRYGDLTEQQQRRAGAIPEGSTKAKDELRDEAFQSSLLSIITPEGWRQIAVLIKFVCRYLPITLLIAGVVVTAVGAAELFGLILCS